MGNMGSVHCKIILHASACGKDHSQCDEVLAELITLEISGAANEKLAQHMLGNTDSWSGSNWLEVLSDAARTLFGAADHPDVDRMFDTCCALSGNRMENMGRREKQALMTNMWCSHVLPEAKHLLDGSSTIHVFMFGGLNEFMDGKTEYNTEDVRVQFWKEFKEYFNCPTLLLGDKTFMMPEIFVRLHGVEAMYESGRSILALVPEQVDQSLDYFRLQGHGSSELFLHNKFACDVDVDLSYPHFYWRKIDVMIVLTVDKHFVVYGHIAFCMPNELMHMSTKLYARLVDRVSSLNALAGWIKEMGEVRNRRWVYFLSGNPWHCSYEQKALDAPRIADYLYTPGTGWSMNPFACGTMKHDAYLHRYELATSPAKHKSDANLARMIVQPLHGFGTEGVWRPRAPLKIQHLWNGIVCKENIFTVPLVGLGPGILLESLHSIEHGSIYYESMSLLESMTRFLRTLPVTVAPHKVFWESFGLYCTSATRPDVDTSNAASSLISDIAESITSNPPVDEYEMELDRQRKGAVIVNRLMAAGHLTH